MELSNAPLDFPGKFAADRIDGIDRGALDLLGGEPLEGSGFEDERVPSVTRLNARLAMWESIGRRKVTSSAEESIKGLDFGIGLVIGRIRRCLQAQPKPPTSAESSTTRPAHSRKPGSQA